MISRFADPEELADELDNKLNPKTNQVMNAATNPGGGMQRECYQREEDQLHEWHVSTYTPHRLLRYHMLRRERIGWGSLEIPNQVVHIRDTLRNHARFGTATH